LVTVVDAKNFLKDFGSAETVYSKNLNADEEDQRAIVNLLTDQIEYANVIIVNKTDLVSEHEAKELTAILHKLNPSATIIPTRNGEVSPQAILNTGLFDFEGAASSAGWQDELTKEHTPETEAYGISSFVFRNKRPFHPDRLWKYITENWPANIIRSKGLLYLASRRDVAISWSQAGGSVKAEQAGVWWASMPYAKRITYISYVENQSYIESKWDKLFGDRLNELVIIGQELRVQDIEQELGNCLLSTDEILDYQEGYKFTDTWPI
jgi:G3E family GTPase